MINALRVDGLGVHERATFTFSPEWTQITGPSMTGKTTLAACLAIAWWGELPNGKPVPTDLIRDDAKLDVEVSYASGTSHRRTMTAKRTTTVYHNDVSTRGGDWADALGGLAEKTLVRSIVYPLQWLELAQGPGGGRPLRDLLIDAAELDEAIDLAEGEPDNEADATKHRAKMRKAADAAEGALREATEAHAEAERIAGAPEVGDLDAARAVVELAKTWTAHHDAMDAYVEREEAIAKAEEALAGWKRDVEALGKKPRASSKGVKALKDARKAREAAADRLKEAQVEHAQALTDCRACQPPIRPRPEAEDAALETARRAYAKASGELKRLPEGKTCPTCKRDGWGDAPEHRKALTERVAELRKEGEEAKKAKEAAEAQIEKDHHEGMEAYRAELAKLQAARDQAAAKVQAAREALAAAQQAADTQADLTSDPVAAWESRSRALGAEPKIPEQLAKPEPPADPCPTEEAQAAAREVLAKAETAAQVGQSVEHAAKRLAAAKKTAEAARKVADRADEIVQLIRDAPAKLLADAVAALGLDDTSLEIIEGEKDRAIEVLVNGRPWWLASRGELAYADFELRAALRGLAGFEWLPLIVDNAQDWSGHWPDVPGPVWLIMTEPGEGLTVEEL